MNSSFPRPFELILVTDRKLSSRPLIEVVERALAAGVAEVQLREKDLDTRELFELACRLRQLSHKAGARLSINHRLDVALASEADGVHLGWRSLPVAEARKLAGRRLRIGLSVHSLEEAIRAEQEGADYVIFGPIFDTPSKEGIVAPRGVEALSRLCGRLCIPVVAIGGINVSNLASIKATGAAGAAVVSAIMKATDPFETTRALLAQAERELPPHD